jgi:hypothetical protein
MTGDRRDEPVTESTGGKGLVLVVEEEAAIADLVRLYLTREGRVARRRPDHATGSEVRVDAGRSDSNTRVLRVGLSVRATPAEVMMTVRLG